MVKIPFTLTFYNYALSYLLIGERVQRKAYQNKAYPYSQNKII